MEEARFPQVAAKAGHYESFYIKTCRPGGGQGIWIRHTVHKRPGQEPNASIWFTLFDAESPGPRATKITVPSAELSSPEGSWIRVADAEIGPGRAHGSIETAALSATWELTFDGSAKPCRYLPADWLYDAPVPRTKFEAPYPDARFSGTMQVNGEELDLSAWPGMVGHNWGTEHAERWVWLEGDRASTAPARPISTPAPRGSSWGRSARPGSPRGCCCSTARRTDWAALGVSAPRRSPRPRPPASSCCPERTSRYAAGSPRPPRTSSAGSTRTPRAPSTTSSTARSPTSS